MASVGPQSPTSITSAGGPAQDWVNPGNVAASDDTRTTCALSGNALFASFTEQLNVLGFDFSAIPSGATVDGIEVTIERSVTSTSGNPRDSILQLAGLTGATTDKSSATVWPTSDGIATYGGPTDKWGATTPSLSEIKSGTFGVYIAAQIDLTEGASTTVRIDHVTIKVYYTGGSVSIVVPVFMNQYRQRWM